MDKSEKFKLKCNATLFAAVSMVASKEETRAYLNGVFCEPIASGGVRMIATDGHTLLIAQDPKGECNKPEIVWMNGDLGKAIMAKNVDSLEIDGEVGTIIDDKGKKSLALAEIVDGTFPDYQRVIPCNYRLIDDEPVLSYQKVEALLKVNTAVQRKLKDDSHLGSSNTAFGIFTVGDKNAPCVVTFNTKLDIFGIVMPMRGEEAARHLPYWYIDKKTQEKAFAAQAKADAKK